MDKVTVNVGSSGTSTRDKTAAFMLACLVMLGLAGLSYPLAGKQVILTLFIVAAITGLAIFTDKSGKYFLASLVLSCLGILFYPQLDWRWPVHGMFVYGSLVFCLMLLSIGILWKYNWTRKISGFPLLSGIITMVFSVVFFLGMLEWSALGLTQAGVLNQYSAMRTLLPPGTDDFRNAHVTADWYREPDPVLFWRSKSGVGPYNKQRFQGPEASIPKVPGVFRIMTYGDSNTDGPDTGGAWSQRLQDVLEREHPHGQLKYEVLNAGVAGYSSYQGLMRFREEVSIYRPDLVLVSFGWNDLAYTSGIPDNEYQVQNKVLVWFVRAAVNFKSYLVVKYYLSQLGSGNSSSGNTNIPRVSMEDYIGNVDGFRELAEKHGAHLVVLTRPHKLPADEIKLRNTFEQRVPDYNKALLKYADDKGLPVIDVQQIFGNAKSPLFVDECHFNAEGHQYMAELLYRTLVNYNLLPDD